MDIICMLLEPFEELPLISGIKNQTWEVKDSNIVQEALKSNKSKWVAKSDGRGI